MDKEKPYIDYSFLGVNSFTELLTQAGTKYTLMDLPDITALYSDEKTFLSSDNDTVVLGEADRDGKKLYFIEFGIMIAPDIDVRSYMVFIYNHIPEFNEIEETVYDIEPLINTHLENTCSEDAGKDKSSKSKESLN